MSNTVIDNLGYASFNPDRLGTAFSFAVALHAALILGITFTQEKHSAKAPQLEVTLAQFKHEKNRDKADYIADRDQQASGAALEKSLLSITLKPCVKGQGNTKTIAWCVL